MNFKPKTEEQLKAERLIADGVYPFEVMEAKDACSKAGNDMIALNLCIFLEDGSTRNLTDFLMEKMMYKLLHFCRETGLGGLYESGNLTPDDCTGKTGWVKIKTQQRKDTGENQNSVADYVPKPGDTFAPSPSKSGPTDQQLSNQSGKDEDVPF
jgi:hypothetical protein